MSMTVDHLVFACTDLDAICDWLTKHTGIPPAAGGSHLGLGTRNAVLSLGERCYLELIAPDPAQPEPSSPRPFALDSIKSPSFQAWAAASDDLDAAVMLARRHGYELNQPLEGYRRTPSGALLSWRMALPTDTQPTPSARGSSLAPLRASAPRPNILPFLIDWSESPHPAQTAPRGCSLRRLWLLTPEPDAVSAVLKAITIEDYVQVVASPGVSLQAELSTPHGTVVLGT